MAAEIPSSMNAANMHTFLAIAAVSRHRNAYLTQSVEHCVWPETVDTGYCRLQVQSILQVRCCSISLRREAFADRQGRARGDVSPELCMFHGAAQWRNSSHGGPSPGQPPPICSTSAGIVPELSDFGQHRANFHRTRCKFVRSPGRSWPASGHHLANLAPVMWRARLVDLDKALPSVREVAGGLLESSPNLAQMFFQAPACESTFCAALWGGVGGGRVNTVGLGEGI